MLCCLIITVQIFVSAEGDCIVTIATHLHSILYKTSGAAIDSLWFPQQPNKVRRAGYSPILRGGGQTWGGVTYPGGLHPAPSVVFLLLSHSQVQSPR